MHICAVSSVFTRHNNKFPFKFHDRIVKKYPESLQVHDVEPEAKKIKQNAAPHIVIPTLFWVRNLRDLENWQLWN